MFSRILVPKISHVSLTSDVDMSGTNTVQDNRPTQQIPNQDKQGQCQTKLGETMAYVLGYSAEVSAFDKARAKLKSKPQDKWLHDSYTEKLAVLQTSVSKKKWKLEKETEDWEKNYFIRNNTLPTYDDLLADSAMKRASKQIKTAKAIMKL